MRRRNFCPCKTKFLNERETAQFLQISIHTVRKWREQGKGPPVTRVGDRCLYNAFELGRWLVAQTPRG